MTGQGKAQLDELLEQYISRVQGLLGSAYRYATASGLMQERDRADIPFVEVEIYTVAGLPHASVKSAVEVLALDFRKKYGIRLSVVFREEGHEGGI